jgi:hypothetical protein
MNAREFFYTVCEMRSAQKSYFKTRDQQVLRAARKLENIVDAEIDRVRGIMVAGQGAKEYRP